MDRLGLIFHSRQGSEGWYGSPAQLQRTAKGARVKEYLQSQKAYTLNRQARKKFPRRRIFSPGIHHIWQTDILQLPGTLRSKGWQGIKYMLSVIDVVSKYAWVIPLSRKDGGSVTEAFMKILKEARPVKVHSDRGKEFVGKQFQAMLKNEGIEWYATHSDVKASIVERFHRTFMNRLTRYFTAVPPKSRIPIRKLIPQMAKSYNNSFHRSIGMAPSQVNSENEDEVLARLYPKTNKVYRAKFQVGDHVRIATSKSMFEKGYRKNFSREVYSVVKVLLTKPRTYVLESSDGIVLKGGFYEQELQKVSIK